MRPLPETLTDPVFNKPEKYSGLDKFFLKMIRDERDLPFIHLTLKLTFIMVPIGLLMYMPFVTGAWWWAAAAVYFFLNNFVYKGSFGLMLHCTSHRLWFKKEYESLNGFLPWFMGPFFGQTPGTYFSHHIGMHHPENNLPEDLSSTMAYKRDSLKSFVVYWMDFFFIGLPKLINYFSKRKRPKLMRKVIIGEASFILFCVGMSFVNFWATFMVFILPFFISRIIMMVGNFAQHTFVDGDDPGNEYKNSITCINVKYNHKCWNDGYHISHHVKPTMHWTDHPIYFKKTLQKYKDNKAFVFEGIGFLTVFWYTMGGSYDKLAKHLVNIDGDTFKDEEEAIALMKHRTKRIKDKKSSKVAAA